LIDGVGFADYSNDFLSLYNAIPKGQDWIDTGYFRVQAYLNGNTKVKWNEDKLHILDKLNSIGSGRSSDLPDTMRKRYKAEHFHDNGAPDPLEFFSLENAKGVNSKKDFAFFPTPRNVARQMVELADYPIDPEPYLTPLETLEPSAGEGALLEFIPQAEGNVAIEFNHHRANELREVFAGTTISEDDFLKWDQNSCIKFDRVLMNPPFNDRDEAYHLVKAFKHLREGGILVCILPTGWFTREDLKSQVMRSFLTKYEHKAPITLPGGTFAGTSVETRIVILKKPENG
jgi:hypothetical protein